MATSGNHETPSPPHNFEYKRWGQARTPDRWSSSDEEELQALCLSDDLDEQGATGPPSPQRTSTPTKKLPSESFGNEDPHCFTRSEVDKMTEDLWCMLEYYQEENDHLDQSSKMNEQKLRLLQMDKRLALEHYSLSGI